METQKKNYVLPIAMMFALFAMISFVTGLQNPMGIIVKNQFGASNFMSQLGNAANFIAYAFMGLPAGLMLQRIGYKKTALAAVAVGFIGVGISYLSGLMSSFSVYLIGAFVSGFSMCMLNTVVNPMLNTLGGGGNRGQPARAVRRFAQLAGRHDRSGAGRLSHGERRTGHDQQRRTRPVHRHGHLRAGLRRDARDGDSRTGSP